MSDINNGSAAHPPPAPALKRVPWFFRFDNAPIQATGLCFDIYARAAVLMSSIFMGPALLILATKAAGCESEQDCDERVYGLMKPSSLLSNIAIVTGVLVSLVTPLVGAIVDHTHHRKKVGIYTALLLTILKGVETMVSSKTWFAVAVLQILSGVLYCSHTCATYAYTSEITKDPNQQTRYNSYYVVILYVSTLIFMAEVLILAFAIGTGDVATARVSQIVTTVTCVVFFSWAWSGLFPDRPPSSQLEKGQNLFTAGFVKVFKTCLEINRSMPALRSLIWAVMFCESSTNSLITISTTFMVHYLDMDTTEIGVVFLIVLVMGIPGSKLGEFIALRFNPLTSAKVCVVYFITVTGAASMSLTGPDKKGMTTIFALLWGIGLGWLHPQHTVLFIALTPTHSQTEYMGIYIFSLQFLSWLPPLMFTILNESNVEMNIGLASLCVFFFLGLVCFCCMGRYDNLALQRDEASGLSGQDEEGTSPQTELPAIS